MSNSTESQDDKFPEPTEVPKDRSFTPRDLKIGEIYKAEVNNIQDYGIFVSLREKPSQISGLVHNKNLPPLTTQADYSIGTKVHVELTDKKPNGDLEFNGVKAPEVAPDAPAESAENRTANPSNIDVTKLIEQIASFESTLKRLEISPDSELSPITHPIDDAIKKLRALKAGGYKANNYQTTTEDGTVEFSISLSKDENDPHNKK